MEELLERGPVSRGIERDVAGGYSPPLKYPHRDDRTIAARINLINIGEMTGEILIENAFDLIKTASPR